MSFNAPHIPVMTGWNLLEAVSFIAFGSADRCPSRFYADKQTELEKATKELLFSIKTNSVKVYGTRHEKTCRIHIVNMEDTIVDIFANNIEIHLNTMLGEQFIACYSDILVDIDDLRQDFKREEIRFDSHFDTEYTTPYIDIIFSVIKNQGITKDNQCKVEYLRNVIKQEMEERGLPSSNKLCSAIATIIRLPESQKGRQRKKN